MIPSGRVLVASALCAIVTLSPIACGSNASGGSGRAADAFANSSTSESTTTAPPTSVTTTTTTLAPDAFDGVDALLAERVRSAGLTGGMLRIVRADGSTVHEHVVGSVTGSTPLSVASSTKWLTAATLLTLVDAGFIGLDDDIARWLPEFAGSRITARMLLTHTSGVRDNACQGDGSPLASCVRTLAVSGREFAAGTRFSYGNAPFLVVGRLVEAVGGADFATVVRARLTGPLGMNATTWPGAPVAANSAFGVRVTVDDYGRFLDMVLHRGVSGGVRVLSEGAIAELVRNQVGGYDTSRDYSVGITRIPRYGLGCWPDVVAPDGSTVVVSGNGGEGLYPWVDWSTNTWGIVGVQDERGAQVAVPASQRVEVAARAVLG